MTTTINADDGSVSGSAGLKSTADNSGVLALQTNGVSALYVSADGRIALGSATNTSSQVYVGGASRVTAATVYQIRADSTVDSATTTTIGFGSTYQFPATGSVTNAYGFLAGTLSTSGATITNYYGFYSNNQTTGTNNYGYFSNMASATGKWNFYASGTADNYFAGNVGIGITTPGYKLDVQSASATINLQSTTTTNLSYITIRNIGYNYVGVENSVGGGLFTGSSAYALALGTVSAYPVQFATNGTVRTTIDTVGNVQVQAGAVMPYAPAPTSIAAATTLTNAQIQGQIINTTGTTYTVTMALGTTLETLATWATTNIAYDFYVVNTASGTITLAVNTGVTSVGTLTVLTGVSAQFRIRRTAANTFVLYRLG